MRRQIEEAEMGVVGVEVELLADDAPILQILGRRCFRGKRLDRRQRPGSE